MLRWVVDQSIALGLDQMALSRGVMAAGSCMAQGFAAGIQGATACSIVAAQALNCSFHPFPAFRQPVPAIPSYGARPGSGAKVG